MEFTVKLGPSINTTANGYHLVSRTLTRTTSKASRQVLDETLQARAKTLGNTPNRVVMEMETSDKSLTYVYEGEYQPTTTEDIECILVYDSETQSYRAERLTSRLNLKTTSVSTVSKPTMTADNLELPTAKKDTEDDELAKELEGMLDDNELEDQLDKELETSEDDEFEEVNPTYPIEEQEEFVFDTIGTPPISSGHSTTGMEDGGLFGSPDNQQANSPLRSEIKDVEFEELDLEF